MMITVSDVPRKIGILFCATPLYQPTFVSALGKMGALRFCVGVAYQAYARLSLGVVVGEMRMEDRQTAGLSPPKFGSILCRR